MSGSVSVSPESVSASAFESSPADISRIPHPALWCSELPLQLLGVA